MGDIIELGLEHALRQGRAGNFDDVRLLSGAPLFSVNVEPDQARTWNVTLLQLRASQNVVAGGSATLQAGIPPDNQVANDWANTSQTNPPPGVTTVIVQLQYGVGQAQEVAYVDYPWNGGTFEINGAFVRGYAISNPLITSIGFGNHQAPRAGAFITPHAHRSRIYEPRLTYNVVNIPGANSTQLFYPPPRASSYRLYTSDGLGTYILGVVVNQVDAVTPILIYQRDGGSGVLPDTTTVPDSVGGVGGAGSLGFRLHPAATAIVVQNVETSLATSHNIGVIWFIDL